MIWLEGINDVGGGHTTDAIIAGYHDIVGRLHAKGIKVFGATLTSALGIGGVDAGDNGPGHDASRKVLNAFIRNSGLFDCRLKNVDGICRLLTDERERLLVIHQRLLPWSSRYV